MPLLSLVTVTLFSGEAMTTMSPASKDSKSVTNLYTSVLGVISSTAVTTQLAFLPLSVVQVMIATPLFVLALLTAPPRLFKFFFIFLKFDRIC